MSRVSKWKLEKTKVKVVFRLQFHATHVPQSGWDKLFISFIPSDTGKPTAKTTKANVRNGNCKWADPIYETTRLLQDSKSKQYDEKLYSIVVAMGSSRAGILGEATINLADFVDALKPSAITLPLQGCNFGTVLHTTIQLLTSKTGFREFEQQRELREGGIQSSEHQTDRASARLKLKADASQISSLEEEANLNEDYADSGTGLDGSSNTSGSLYAEKHETSSTHEDDSLKSTASVDLHGLYHSQSPSTVKENPPDHQNPAQGTSGSAQGWGSDNSIDNELAVTCQENNRLRGSLELAESSFFSLKLEVSSLQSLADELGAETQKFSHQLSAETSTAEELGKEVSVLKLECLKLKDDINGLKDLKVSRQISSVETSDNQVDHLARNMQLQFVNGISVVENKIRDLQKKMYAVPHDGDTKFIYLELDALLNFLLDFKLGNGEVAALREDVKEIRELGRFKDEPFVSGNGLGLDLCEPESVLHHFNAGPPMSEVGVIDAMKGQIFDLVRELDEGKVEKEALTRKMNHMECYYEALIQELEENQKRLVAELQHLTNEHSTCLYALSVSKTETESLREDMNQQMVRFVEERREWDAIHKELERRATTSEAALRRARLNYSIAVDKLQKDLELLSSQVFSMFETNENLIKRALPSEPDSSSQLENQKLGLRKRSVGGDNSSSQLENQKLGLRKRSVGGDSLLEDLKRSFVMQEELNQKAQEELIEMYSINLNLDIYSKVLEQCLCGADADVRIMKGRMSELLEELELSTASQNHLMARLQTASDEIHALNEFKSSSISQCSDMALQNRILEEKLVSISGENYLLNQKLKEWESIMLEMRSYESKYAACSAENAELSLQLKQEALENENLTDELSHVREKLMIVTADLDELVSYKGKLEGNIKFVEDKLVNLLSSYNKQFCPNFQSLDLDSVDIKDAVLQLEEIQTSAFVKNCQLMEQNQNLKSEKADADVSLSAVRSEILTMKQKFRSGIRDMVAKLDVPNAVVDKLQAELESVAEKLQLNSEIEERFVQQNEVLLADLALLEEQMQELTCRKGHLAREISGIDSLAEELGRSELNISELMHDKQELALYLQEKTEESLKLSCEISRLKESLKTLRDELDGEKAYKDELEEKVQDLTICLSMYQDKLLVFEQQRDELLQVRELASDLEMEKSKLMEENQNLKSEKADADVSLSAVRTEILTMKQKYKSGIRDMVAKLDFSNAVVDKLQGELGSVSEKIQLNSEIEEKFVRQNEVLLADLAVLEDQMQENISELMRDKQELAFYLQEKTEESVRLTCENIRLKESLETLHNELVREKAYKDQLEEKVEDLTICLSKYQDKLLVFEQQKDELLHVKKLESDLEMENSRLAHLVGQQNEKLEKNSSYQVCFESELSEMLDYALAANVRLIYVSNQYEALVDELLQKLVSSEECLSELQKRYHDTKSMSSEGEANWRQEKSDLLASLESLRSDLEASGAENKFLTDSENEIRNQLEECKGKLSMMKTHFSTGASEVERLKNMMTNAEEEIDSLTFSKEELEILVIVLKGKVGEQTATITLLDEYKDELMMLRSQFNELSHKLAEQALKTEEFKNLSIHLKEQKDKAEAECVAAREKRETEVPSATVQDSLRIAFIKEQCETKVQELKQQLSISKKHGEEMLLKLQDAIDEIENRKKSEAVSLKKNKELSVRLSALEVELTSAISEKREKSNAYDRANAELECALLSLECCKEEKEKLAASFLEFEAEKSQLTMELTLVKRQLENLKSLNFFEKDEYLSESTYGKNEDSTEPIPILDGENAASTESVQLQTAQDAALPQSNGKISRVNREHLGAQRLRSSIEHLHEELEKMKNENTVLSMGHDVDSEFHVTQSEIMQLHKANEELRRMFPSFDEISGDGNALDRVLALEMELAESLKTKNKTNIQFQSSFLKQHGDEEAVFKSFRDINELIKEMLELKGRHAGIEDELREMHDRYSQLSLQFAEVEGERQKLKMTLKNVRASKKLNRSSSDNVMDQPL